MKLPDPTRAMEAQEEDLLLAMCVFGESRGQCDEAKLGVANVVHTRMKDPRRRYGHGWSGVILRPLAFSCFNRMDANRKKLLCPLDWEKPEVWQACWEIARKVYEGTEPDNTQSATHYYDDSLVRRGGHPPLWAERMSPTVKIGSLNFFREN